MDDTGYFSLSVLENVSSVRFHRPLRSDVLLEPPSRCKSGVLLWSGGEAKRCGRTTIIQSQFVRAVVHKAVFNDENLSYRLQSAFILNLQNHWLPIRRFSSPNRWYNLNSFLDAPQWISPTFLAMVLAQAEEEGYNVFVVRPLDSTALGDAENGTTSALPESQADLVALELGEPDGRSGGGVSNISTGEYVSTGQRL
jgi:hypothetical protein